MKKILLINDSVFENFVMRDMLESIGYEVEVSNEFEAFGALEQFDPNIVIANFIMKKTTGDKLLNKMKMERIEIKTILSSSSEVKLKDLRENKIDYFLPIPMKKDELEKVLSKFDEITAGNSESEKFVDNLKVKFCTKCGEKLNDMSENSKYCPYCGNKI